MLYEVPGPDYLTGETDQPPTWADVERAALHCPVLHAAVTLVRAGRFTREEALTIAAVHLSKFRANALSRGADRLANLARTGGVCE